MPPLLSLAPLPESETSDGTAEVWVLEARFGGELPTYL